MRDCKDGADKLNVKIKTLEKNITEQSKYDFAKCKGITESSLSLITRVQKCDRELKTCESGLSSEIEKVDSCDKLKNDLAADLLKAVDATAVANDTIDTCVKEGNELKLKIQALEDEIQTMASIYADTLAGLRSTVDMMQSDFDAVGICRKTEENSNCSGIIESYLCLPRTLTTKLCSTAYDVRLNLFGLKSCLLIGDENLLSMDWRAYLENNPISSSVILILLILSFWGVVCFAALLIFGCWKCYKIGSTDLDEEDSLGLATPNLNKKWGTLVRTTRSCSLDKMGLDTDTIKLQSFKSTGKI